MFVASIVYRVSKNENWSHFHTNVKSTRNDAVEYIEDYLKNKSSALVGYQVRYTINDCNEIYEVKLNAVVKERINIDGTPYSSVNVAEKAVVEI